MALITHVGGIRNTNYNQSVEYLTKQHEEISDRNGKIVKYEPVFSDDGSLKERDNYEISYLKSDGTNGNLKDWSNDCRETNFKFQKNSNENDIKAHHYVISYPTDDTINGLTAEKAQKAAEEYCKKNFPGYQCLICTHTDTGNIHTHIIINSVREREIEKENWMTKGKDGQIKKSQYEAGGKHTNSAKLAHHLMSEVDEMCKKHGFTMENYSDQNKRREDLKQNGKMNDGKHFAVTKAQERMEYMHDSVIEAAKSSKNFKELQKKLEDEYNLKIYMRGSASISVIHPELKSPKNLQTIGLTPLDLTPDMHRHYYKTQHSYEGVYDKWNNPETRFEKHKKKEYESEEGKLKLDEEKDEYYRKGWNNSNTFKAHTVSRFNADGEPRSLLESIYILAYSVVNNEMPEWAKTDRQKLFEANNDREKQIYMPTEQKLENLNQAIQYAKEMQIDTPEQLSKKLQNKDLSVDEKAKVEFLKEQYDLAGDKEYCYSRIFKKRQQQLKEDSKESIELARKQLEEIQRKIKRNKPLKKEEEEYRQEQAMAEKASDFRVIHEGREARQQAKGPERTR